MGLFVLFFSFLELDLIDLYSVLRIGKAVIDREPVVVADVSPLRSLTENAVSCASEDCSVRLSSASAVDC
jgi:hypothetical protein